MENYIEEIQNNLRRLEIEYDDMCNYASDVDGEAVDGSSTLFQCSLARIYEILNKLKK